MCNNSIRVVFTVSDVRRMGESSDAKKKIKPLVNCANSVTQCTIVYLSDNSDALW